MASGFILLVTRMPSTGKVTNITQTTGPIEEVRARWADNPNVEVMEEAEFDARACFACGRIAGMENTGCCYCR